MTMTVLYYLCQKSGYIFISVCMLLKSYERNLMIFGSTAQGTVC